MRKLTVSGEILVGNTPELFDNIVVVMGSCPSDCILGNLKARYLENAIRKQLGKSFTSIRQFNIDSIEELEELPNFYDRSIFEMDKEQLNDFCCEFNFSDISVKQKIEDVRNTIAVRWIEFKTGYKVEETEFYVHNVETNSNYVDYKRMRDESLKSMFTVSYEDKPRDVKVNNINIGKVKINELRNAFNSKKDEVDKNEKSDKKINKNKLEKKEKLVSINDSEADEENNDELIDLRKSN